MRNSGSRTAVVVCMARAAAHGVTPVSAFSDPTALPLLPARERARVERFRMGEVPKGVRARMQREFLERRSKMMVARTVAIDDALRQALAPQLVILGAGLDGRAFRMPELRDVRVFEVDHPYTQREKRARVASLTQTAREVCWVPVDFARDNLDAELALAGHDPMLPTVWLWEGVVMYLSRPAIEATLQVVARRSAPGSRLVIAYISPARILPIVGLALRALGEPLRSVFTAQAMHELLLRFGFRVTSDEDVPAISARLSDVVAQSTRPLKHARIVTAVRDALA